MTIILTCLVGVIVGLYLGTGIVHNILMIREIRNAHKSQKAVDEYTKVLKNRMKDLGVMIVGGGGEPPRGGPQMDA
jgi:hypothetical protein